MTFASLDLTPIRTHSLHPQNTRLSPLNRQAPSRQDHRKDLWNNRFGREIGLKWAFLGEYAKATATADCLAAVYDGRLIIDQDLAPYYPGEEKIIRQTGNGGSAW